MYDQEVYRQKTYLLTVTFVLFPIQRNSSHLLSIILVCYAGSFDRSKGGVIGVGHSESDWGRIVGRTRFHKTVFKKILRR